MKTNKPVNAISASPINPRRIIEDADFQGLCDSIRRLGILEPLLVRPTGEIVAGHRRYAAAQKVGLSEVPVIELECSDDQRSEYMLAENLHRKDLTFSEAGALLAEMKKDLSKAKLVKLTGLTGRRIDDCLMVLGLPDKLRTWADNGILSIQKAWTFHRLPDERKNEITLRLSDETLTPDGLVRWVMFGDGDGHGGKPKKDYATERQIDISWAVDQCIAMRTRLEKYRDLTDIPPYITKIENQLQQVSRDLHRLCEEIVDSARVR